MTNKMAVNEKIRSYQVRMIDEVGNQRGVVSTREALDYARSIDLDVVQIADTTPPVVKIVDAGKYFYEQQKRQKELAKKQRETAIDVKEVQLNCRTDIHDIKIKARKAREFISDGNLVKVSVTFRGREITHKDIGYNVLQKFVAELGDHRVDKAPSESGRQITAVYGPVKK